MIGYVDVEEQVDKDFRRALMKASLRRWRDRLRQDPYRCRLVPFDEAKGALAWWGQAYRGMRTVEVEKITGSVGRHRDFDASFLPLKRSMAERWGRVDRAYHRGVELPTVSLYKVGDEYFVRDGHHRVSVARYHGVVAIDAEVVEIGGRLRADAGPRAVRPAGGEMVRHPELPSEAGASATRELARRLRTALARSGVRGAAGLTQHAGNTEPCPPTFDGERCQVPRLPSRWPDPPANLLARVSVK